MKKSFVMLTVFVAMIATTVQANPPDTLTYDASKTHCNSSFLAKGSTAIISEADSVVVIATDSVNNSKRIAIYAGGKISFTEWVEADYIVIPSNKDDSKLTIIAIGGDSDSPADPKAGLLSIFLIVVVLAGSGYGIFRLWK